MRVETEAQGVHSEEYPTLRRAVFAARRPRCVACRPLPGVSIYDMLALVYLSPTSARIKTSLIPLANGVCKNSRLHLPLAGTPSASPTTQA